MLLMFQEVTRDSEVNGANDSIQKITINEGSQANLSAVHSSIMEEVSA